MVVNADEGPDPGLGRVPDPVEQARKTSTVPAQLPDGLSAILNPGNVKAVVESDAIDPLKLAAAIPAATPVLLTCSDSDGQANCADITPLADALEHTSLSLVALKGVNHVLRDDPTEASAISSWLQVDQAVHELTRSPEADDKLN